MRHFKFFVGVVMAICLTSCNSCGDDEEELTGHNKVDVVTFKTMMDAEENPQILDYRSASYFEVGHIPGAVNIEATVVNTDGDDGEFMKAVKSKFSPSKNIYIYGGSDSWGTLGNVVPGRIANTWGKNKTYLLDGGYFSWIEADYDIER